MTGARTASTDERRERLRAYLHRHVADGEYYFKSRFIAEDLGMSPKELGALLADLRESADTLRIEKWAYTGATTWRAVALDADA